MSIRKVRYSDVPEILEIVKRLKKWFEPEVPSNIKRTIHNLKGFVFIGHGRIIGFVLYKVWKKTAEIKWIGVLQGYHSKGIGTKLMNAVEKEIAGKGIEDITVTTLVSSLRYRHFAKTRRFYFSRGFKKIRVDKKFWKNKYDRLVLIKEL